MQDADKVEHAYLVDIYAKFGESHKILSDNGRDFLKYPLSKYASML